MKIEDFIQVYTPLELDRFEHKKREEGNLQRNALLGNLGRHVVNEKTRGKHDISPEKAVRLFREVIGSQRFTQCVAITKSPTKRAPMPSKSPKRDIVRNTLSDESY